MHLAQIGNILLVVVMLLAIYETALTQKGAQLQDKSSTKST